MFFTIVLRKGSLKHKVWGLLEVENTRFITVSLFFGSQMLVKDLCSRPMISPSASLRAFTQRSSGRPCDFSSSSGIARTVG